MPPPRSVTARAAGIARQTFEQGSIAAGLPTVEIPEAELQAGVPAFDLLRRAGLAASNAEARRLVRGKGARLNDEMVEIEDSRITLADLKDGVIKLSAGRKRHVLVKPA